MFGISFSEAILIFFILLIVVGPKQLPVVSRNVAIFYKKMNIFARNLKQSIDDSLYDFSSIEQNSSDEKIKDKDEEWSEQ